MNQHNFSEFIAGLETRIVKLKDALRVAQQLLCGRIGGCLGKDCGCSKGNLDMGLSAEQRRMSGWVHILKVLEKPNE